MCFYRTSKRSSDKITSFLEITIPDEVMQKHCIGDIGPASKWLSRNKRKRPHDSNSFEQAREMFEKSKLFKLEEDDLDSVLNEF